MIHHNTARKRIGFYLINTSRPRKQLGINACISSRITTVIQVVKYYQINYNWYNEPFAVSQYKLFILRHAWLNLWDKRMTTGRINQVTSPWYGVEKLILINSHSYWNIIASTFHCRCGINKSTIVFLTSSYSLTL